MAIFCVSRSIDLGRPLIVVSINYRLGYFGFIHSKELREEARANGEAGFSKFGLHDQRLALQWVRRTRDHNFLFTLMTMNE
jgi:carboxylesterase type B